MPTSYNFYNLTYKPLIFCFENFRQYLKETIDGWPVRILFERRNKVHALFDSWSLLTLRGFGENWSSVMYPSKCLKEWCKRHGFFKLLIPICGPSLISSVYSRGRFGLWTTPSRGSKSASRGFLYSNICTALYSPMNFLPTSAPSICS